MVVFCYHDDRSLRSFSIFFFNYFRLDIHTDGKGAFKTKKKPVNLVNLSVIPCLEAEIQIGECRDVYGV